MKSRPILFSAPMVCALLAGTKTQTRRAIKIRGVSYLGGAGGDTSDPGNWGYEDDNGEYGVLAAHGANTQVSSDYVLPCRYGVPGDRLWVRETWCQSFDDSGMFVYNADGNLDPTCCWYAADGVEVTAQDGDGFTRYRKDGTEASPWSPSIHMPRWASRITLEITDVRVQRLQDISEQDAIAEGVAAGVYYDGAAEEPRTAAAAYAQLWDSIHGRDACAANPWVWALTFKRVMP